MQIAFEFHLSFQKMWVYQLIDSSFSLAKFILNPFSAFEFLFTYWMMNILEFSGILENWTELSIGFWKKQIDAVVANEKP